MLNHTLDSSNEHSFAAEAGYTQDQAVFVTAYRDRQSASFKKTSGSLAWNSYAWFQAEPNGIWILKHGDYFLENL